MRWALWILLVSTPALAQRTDADRVASAKQMYAEGKRYYDIGDYPRAIDTWKRAYLVANAPMLLFNIAQAYRLAGDCTEALRLGPKYGLALQNRGHAYLRTGQFDLALADFEARLALGNSAYALYGRGVAKLKKGDSSGSVDIAMAKGQQSDVAVYYSSRGVPPPQP